MYGFLIAHEEGPAGTEADAFRPVGCICGLGGQPTLASAETLRGD